MGKQKKKGKVGKATHYVSRNRALKKLGISLADFRRVCILKGIYPRAPKGIGAGNTKAPMYHRKDIAFISRDDLLFSIHESKLHKRKVAHKINKKEFTEARRLMELKPELSLDHLVRERYPTFQDALRDLDDALSMVALFASLAASSGVPAEIIRDCQRLHREFVLYVASTHALRKVFFSTKGVYFSAAVAGVEVSWVEPHSFAHSVPKDVDTRVMRTFVEFHRVLLGFVLFRLYAAEALNRAYPPDVQLDGALELAALDVPRDTPEAFVAADDDGARAQRLFAGLTFFLSREVPSRLMELVILSAGGAVAGGATPPDGVTHVIVDRPPASLARSLGGAREGVEYLQPQWVLDSFNARVLLPTGPYRPGHELPPHLSPFVNPLLGGEAEHVPERQREIERIVKRAREREGIDADESGAEGGAPARKARAQAEAPAPEALYNSSSLLRAGPERAAHLSEGSKNHGNRVTSRERQRMREAVASRRQRRFHSRIKRIEKGRDKRLSELRARAKGAEGAK